MTARFQSFEDTTDRATSGPRLAQLRAELARRGLDGFVVPRADRYQNEYVPPSDERLSWLTGFSGSAGTAIVLAERAGLFVDGRYTLQAREQVDTDLFEIVLVTETPPDQWIEKVLRDGQKLGYDPWLHTIEGAERLAKACAAASASLVASEPNPVDAVWTDRPPAPLGAVVVQAEQFAGEPATQKLARIRAELARLKADALVVSDPHAVCWTFNIRGSDVAHTPLALAFAIVPSEGRPALFVDGRKLDNAVRTALDELADLCEPAAFGAALEALGAGHRTVRLDPAGAADAIARLVAAGGGRIKRGPDPIAAMKAIKNATERDGARAAHRRDGAAVTRFLAWFDRTVPAGKLTEIDAVVALEDFRRHTGVLKDVSFPTIAGFGPNGAIVHYRVTLKTNRGIAPDGIFLIDSGAQYQDGTTDITRTIATGTP
ncbi:MAG TPA: aminopeptidase P family N-terminal domain-containing protein, partial [Xanthobacteraceae bacterium]